MRRGLDMDAETTNAMDSREPWATLVDLRRDLSPAAWAWLEKTVKELSLARHRGEDPQALARVLVGRKAAQRLMTGRQRDRVDRALGVMTTEARSPLGAVLTIIRAPQGLDSMIAAGPLPGESVRRMSALDRVEVPLVQDRPSWATRGPGMEGRPSWVVVLQARGEIMVFWDAAINAPEASMTERLGTASQILDSWRDLGLSVRASIPEDPRTLLARGAPVYVRARTLG